MIKSYVNDGALNHKSNVETQKSELASGPEVSVTKGQKPVDQREKRRQLAPGTQLGNPGNI